MATVSISSIVPTSIQAGLARSAAARTPQQARVTLASASSAYFGTSDLVVSRAQTKAVKRVSVGAVRCETKTGGNTGPDIWVGRAAMLGFVAALATEIATGKGVLASAGVGTPQPTLALALAALAGGVTAFGVFRSASSE
ncbi:hypothetical protein R1sor_006842 [Riccia sorocarpa]|uniref:Stress enhanced protein 1, chloroplastic n=1 Tax=Riccia sorocarpa TaxID=122646 RepID=A0ABD3HSU1_9MARC